MQALDLQELLVSQFLLDDGLHRHDLGLDTCLDARVHRVLAAHLGRGEEPLVLVLLHHRDLVAGVARVVVVDDGVGAAQQPARHAAGLGPAVRVEQDLQPATAALDQRAQVLRNEGGRAVSGCLCAPGGGGRGGRAGRTLSRSQASITSRADTSMSQPAHSKPSMDGTVASSLRPSLRIMSALRTW